MQLLSTVSPKVPKIKHPREWKDLSKIIVIVGVAIIGIITLLLSLASTATYTFSSYLPPKSPVRSYSVSSQYSGTLTANLTYSNITSASLYMYNSSGALIASGSGAYPIKISSSVAAGSYKFVVRGSVTSKQNSFTLTVTVPNTAPVDTTSPSTPTGLTASAASSSQINLGWTASTDNVGVTGYDIYRNNVLIGSSVSTSYSDSTLSPGTTYSYQLKARDAAGNTSALSATASATTLASASYITASGTHFMQNGSVFHFIGFNAYGMEGCYNGSPWSTTQLDTYFSKLPANGVTRLWAFQSYGTGPIQTIVNEAAKYHQHLILTLGDDDSNCGETDGSVSGIGSGKTLTFYESGWQGNYLTWVNTIVPLFKTNPAIMMWEVANEPGHKGAIPTETVMQAYIQGTSDAIRADDPNHLIGVGANIAKDFGGATAFAQVMNVPNIDAISFHDYSYQYENGAEISGNFKTAQAASTQDNKPFYAGEAGVPSGSTCSNVNYTSLTLSSRVSFLQTKANDYFPGNLGGITFWEYEPSQASWVGACAYEIYPTDPMVTMVQSYPLP